VSPIQHRLERKGQKAGIAVEGHTPSRNLDQILGVGLAFAIGSNGVPEFVMQLIKRCRAPIGSVWHAQGDRAPRRC
jgi:hypothetical protein